PFISKISMAKENKIHMPGVFGGLMRYDEEFKSRFMITPAQVIGFIIAIIVFVLILKLIFPIQTVNPPIPNAPGHGQFIIPLLTSLL
ncbi:MAG: preprotein translocase subunit Sec61beta, partial [Bacteroidetes bacterium]